jgi:hypothetical protein
VGSPSAQTDLTRNLAKVNDASERVRAAGVLGVAFGFS